MPRPNFFELLNLEFDPPVNDRSKLEEAIAVWKTTLERRRGAGANTQVEQELKYESELRAVMLNAGERKKEAMALKIERSEQLRQILELLSYGEQEEQLVTKAQIRESGKKLGLSPATAERIFTEKHFTVQTVNATVNLSDHFLPDNIMNDIIEALEVIRKCKDNRYAWLSKIQDLYALCCFMDGKDEMRISDYRKASSHKLRAIVQKWGVDNSTDQSDVGIKLNQLAAKAEAQVFNTEQNMEKYNNSLKLETIKSFFDMLKKTPRAFLHDPQFAEKCIDKLSRLFGDHDLALSLYNSKAGLMQDPYEPFLPMIHVTCPTCRTISQFRSRREAESARCSACGTALYLRCPSCDELVPAAVLQCKCSFRIVEMRFFDEYYKAAEEALSHMCIDDAQASYSRALAANPKEPRLKQLEEKIKHTSETYKKPLEEINKFIRAGQYMAARRQLEDTVTRYPMLNLTEVQKQISAKLKQAASMMPQPNDPYAAAKCLSILEIVKDYTPAIDRLKGEPLKVPRQFSATAKQNGRSLSCTLLWQSAGDIGVTYCICRKENARPTNQADGTIVANKLTKLEFTDTTVQPGVAYYYAVFAQRYGAVSPPVFAEVVNFNDLDNATLHVTETNDGISFRWALPARCIGVRVLCATDGAAPDTEPTARTTVKGQCEVNSFSINGLQTGRLHTFRLQCVYEYNGARRYSSGIVRNFTPNPDPKPLENVNVLVKGDCVTVCWKKTVIRQDLMVCEVEDSSPILSRAEKKIDTTELTRYIKRIVVSSNSGTEDSASYIIPLNMKKKYIIAVSLSSRSYISYIFEAVGVESCDLDRTKTKVENNVLYAVLQQIPSNLLRLYYAVSVKQNPSDPPPFRTADDAKSGMMDCLPIENYKNAAMGGALIINNMPQKELYLTVIGEIDVGHGKTWFTTPSKQKLSNTPPDRIEYSFTRNFITGKRHLTVRAQCNELPQMFLVYHRNGGIPTALNDPGICQLLTIPEMDEDTFFGKWHRKYTVELPANSPADDQLRLMVRSNMVSVYDLIRR